VRLGKMHDLGVIGRRGAKLRGKLFRGQPLVKARAGWIIKLFEQVGERVLIAQRQSDGQL